MKTKFKIGDKVIVYNPPSLERNIKEGFHGIVSSDSFSYIGFPSQCVRVHGTGTGTGGGGEVISRCDLLELLDNLITKQQKQDNLSYWDSIAE